jgi:hypothetical protein
VAIDHLDSGGVLLGGADEVAIDRSPRLNQRARSPNNITPPAE